MINKKTFSLIAVVLLLVIVLTSCKKESNAPEGMVELSDDSHAYNFYVYTQWVKDENNSQCAYYSTADRSNVSMSAYIPDADHASVADYYNDLKEQYKKDFEDFDVVEEGTDAKIFKYNAYKMVYTFSFGGEQFKVMQVLTLHGGLIYVFTYTSSPENYDKHIEQANKMLAEITFEA